MMNIKQIENAHRLFFFSSIYVFIFILYFPKNLILHDKREINFSYLSSLLDKYHSQDEHSRFITRRQH